MRVKLRNNKYNISNVRLGEKEKKTIEAPGKQLTLFLVKLTVVNLISFDWQKV